METHRWGVFLRLPVLLGERNHIRLGRSVEPLASIYEMSILAWHAQCGETRLTNDSISVVLLGALARSSEQELDCIAREDSANLPWAGSTKLVENRRPLLTETPGIKLDGTSIPLKPAHPSEDPVCAGEQHQSNCRSEKSRFDHGERASRSKGGTREDAKESVFESLKQRLLV